MNWRYLFGRKRENEINEEIESHLQMAIRDRMARGESEQQARAAAQREFGNVGLVKESTRDVWVWTALEHLLQDLRFGCRIMTRSPALGATAVILIALVIGGNTTLYSIIHSVLTSPAGGVEPDGLVALGVSIDGRTDDPANSYPNYVDYAEQTKTLSYLLVRGNQGFTLGTRTGSYEVWGSLASSNYFETLGVRLFKGRTFTEEENRRDTSGLVVVISHRLWQNHLQGGENIIGQPISLNGHAATIIGVGPPGFTGPEFNAFTDLWVPVLSYSRLQGTENTLIDRSLRWFEMYGRLAPGVTLAEAQVEFDAISARLQAAYPEVLTRFGGEITNGNMTAVLAPYSAGAFSPMNRMAGPFLAIFSVVTFLTLLIVSANVANLMLARAVVRQREMAVRQSLGASRMRILRVLVAEGVVISLTAWVTACLIALLVSRLALLLIPQEGLSANVNFTPDWQVAGYAMLLAIVATLVFTTAPAIHAWRQELLPWLKAGGSGVVRSRSRFSSILVVAQLAFSVVLLTGAGLAYRSLSLIDRPEDLGFNTDNILLVTVNTEDGAASAEANVVLLDRLRERLLSVPGIQFASYSRGVGGPFRPLAVHPVDSETTVSTAYNYVGPDHLRVLGLAPLLGRDLTGEEGTRTNRSAVITQSLASTVFPGRSPIGETLALETRDQEQTLEVVGVAPNGFFLGPARGANTNFVFLSAEQIPDEPGITVFYLRYAADLNTLIPAIGSALTEIDARIPIVEVRTMEAQLESLTSPARIITILLTLFAAGSLAIAVVGQYAAVAFNMRRRTRDFALRLALGASSRQILNSVLQEGLWLTGIGLLIGFALALATGRVFGSLLYGVTPTDQPTYLGVFTVLAAASLLACYLPARRAAAIDPAQTLRQE